MESISHGSVVLLHTFRSCGVNKSSLFKLFYSDSNDFYDQFEPLYSIMEIIIMTEKNIEGSKIILMFQNLFYEAAEK